MCTLQGKSIGTFNATILFNSNIHSVANANTYFISPDQIIYNYQVYAGKLRKISLFTDFSIKIENRNYWTYAESWKQTWLNTSENHGEFSLQ